MISAYSWTVKLDYNHHWWSYNILYRSTIGQESFMVQPCQASSPKSQMYFASCFGCECEMCQAAVWTLSSVSWPGSAQQWCVWLALKTGTYPNKDKNPEYGPAQVQRAPTSTFRFCRLTLFCTLILIIFDGDTFHPASPQQTLTLLTQPSALHPHIQRPIAAEAEAAVEAV